MTVQSPHIHEIGEACEVLGWPGHSALVLTCEHASNDVPPTCLVSRRDRPWLQTHWAFDIGAAELTREIVRDTGSAAVLARVSRLVCDTNRHPSDPTLIARSVEQHALSFNELLSATDRVQRIERYHVPFHTAVDRLIEARHSAGGDIAVVSIHSFVPALDGLRHSIDVGVLFNPHEAIARRLAAGLRDRGLTVGLNEPYSGRRGLIYSAERHGLQHQAVYLEIEVNQALLSTPARTYHVARLVAGALSDLRLRTSDR
jgi:predicted N-formylglutamate amidohydrolase